MNPLRIAIVNSVDWSLPPDPELDIVPVAPDADCSAYCLTVVPWAQRGAPAFRTARTSFVLLAATDTTPDLWNCSTVAGFGRAADPQTWQEVQHVIAELKARDQSQEVAPLPAAPGSLDSLFISHFRGVMRQFYRDLRDILLNLQPCTAFADPLQGITPAQWLNFYGHRKLGAFLTPEQATELWQNVISKKVSGRNPEKGEEAFARIFYRPDATGGGKPILLLGETGTGKTVVAHMIHRHLSQHRPSEKAYTPPLTQINCAGLGDLLESELFGAMAGAYTSADITNPGKIVASYGGVLFLDEIGTMSPRAQAKLLTYLDRGEVTPQGWAAPPLRVPVQIVAATNADLLDEVQRGNFRADLYYRFEQRLYIPPLRERGEPDLQLLIQHLLADPAINPTRQGWRVQGVSQEALKKLLQHDYPGNYRELQSVLREGVKSATRLRDQYLHAQDIAFEKTPLPLQHSVVGIIKKREDGQDWFLLRFNPYWLQYFLIGGRFEASSHTFEHALAQELSTKLGLAADCYTLRPVETAREVTLIQYSDRDKQLKHYAFHLYSVKLTADPWSPEDLQDRGLLWATLAHITQERGPGGERISRTTRDIVARAGVFADHARCPASFSR